MLDPTAFPSNESLGYSQVPLRGSKASARGGIFAGAVRFAQQKVVALFVLALWPAVALAQSEAAPPGSAVPPKTETPAAPAPTAADKLAVEQQRIGDRFKRFEEVLLRMAELNAGTDPRRAALLRKAVAQSKDRLIGVQLETLVELLQKDQLARATENQTAVQQDLQSLLDLLMSENRAKRLESEKARVREYLKRLSALINQQKDVQGRTAGGGEPKHLAGEQARVADKAGGLAKDIRNNEEDPNKPASKPQGPKDGEGPKDGPSKPPPAAPPKSGGKEGRQDSPQPGKPTEQGAPKQAGQAQPKSQGGEPKGPTPPQGQGQPKDQGPPPKQGDAPPQAQEQPAAQQDNPARKRLEAAESRMREAEKSLQEAQREGAVRKQEEAIRELEQARSALEEILRQLREEEVQRMLTSLEARFNKMLQMQREVLEGTVRLDKIPQSERTHEHEIHSGRLSSKEAEIDLEAEKALTLLREDGSAMAFPEALGQVRQDIRQVVERLSAARVDKITQGIEEDIIASFDEMLRALKKALKDQEKRKQRSGAAGGSAPMEPPLVDVLAELRMIRTLQLRVNMRTDRYSKLIQGEQADKPDLLEALKRLAERQDQIHKITRDLSLGKNQ